MLTAANRLLRPHDSQRVTIRRQRHRRRQPERSDVHFPLIRFTSRLDRYTLRSAPTCWAATAFVLLAIGHTWPLAIDLTRLSSLDSGDAQRDVWIVSWIAHRLPQDPLRLFDANIFHPTKYALAYSDQLLAPALIGTPLQWLGASPVRPVGVT